VVRAQPGYKSSRGQSAPAQARMLPYQRTVKRMEDYWENRDGRIGYCWCGCGEETGIAKHTDAKRGRFRGEHVAFLPGHAARLKKPSGQVPPEKIETIRYLHNNSPMKSPEIAQIVDLSAGFVRSIALNQVPSYYDPDYTPISHEARMKLIYPHQMLTCEICGANFESKGPRRNRSTCGKRECFLEFRRLHPPPMTDEVKTILSEQAFDRHARGVYKDSTWPPSQAQREWRDRVPDHKPDWMDPSRWDAFFAHVAEGITYEDLARARGGSSTKYKQRVERAIEDLERGGPKPVDHTKKKEAARRRWRNVRGRFS
jgi:hypothetical protein